MTRTTLKEGLRGVPAGLLTPFGEDLAVDHDALAANARELADRGLETFLACANVSEYHSLSHEERIAVTETAVRALPADAMVLAGVGGATPNAVDLIEAADAAGADAMMVMPPDHTFVHERGLLSYYRKLGAAAEAPLVPYVRSFEPSVRFLADLSALECVAGVKYALPDVPTFAAAREAGDDVVWVEGMGEPHAPALWAEGAEGFTAGVSNFAPRIGLALFEALSAGDWERAREIRTACQPFMDLRAESGTDSSLPAGLSVPVLKEGLRLAGLEPGTVREPLVELTEEERARVADLYDDLAAFETPEV